MRQLRLLPSPPSWCFKTIAIFIRINSSFNLRNAMASQMMRIFCSWLNLIFAAKRNEKFMDVLVIQLLFQVKTYPEPIVICNSASLTMNSSLYRWTQHQISYLRRLRNRAEHQKWGNLRSDFCKCLGALAAKIWKWQQPAKQNRKPFIRQSIGFVERLCNNLFGYCFRHRHYLSE